MKALLLTAPVITLMVAVMANGTVFASSPPVVRRADDPGAEETVRSILGVSYETLRPILRLGSVVRSSEPIAALGGQVQILPSGGRVEFYFTPHAPPGVLLVFPDAVISAQYSPSAADEQRLLRSHAEFDGKVIRSDPSVDFILFADGSHWGHDRTGFMAEIEGLPQELERIAGDLEGKSAAEAVEFLRAHMPVHNGMAMLFVPELVMTHWAGDRRKIQAELIRLSQGEAQRTVGFQPRAIRDAGGVK